MTHKVLALGLRVVGMQRPRLYTLLSGLLSIFLALKCSSFTEFPPQPSPSSSPATVTPGNPTYSLPPLPCLQGGSVHSSRRLSRSSLLGSWVPGSDSSLLIIRQLWLMTMTDIRLTGRLLCAQYLICIILFNSHHNLMGPTRLSLSPYHR